MPLPEWSDVRNSLTDAIRAALPFQIKKANGERIAGLGLHFNACYGSAGLYLLPESAARNLGKGRVDNIGDWPISTDWDLNDDHSVAFTSHWQPWDDWFRDHLDDLPEPEVAEMTLQLHVVFCEAMRQIEVDGLLDAMPKTDDFKIIIVEHDEPYDLAVERFDLFKRTNTLRIFGCTDDGTTFGVEEVSL